MTVNNDVKSEMRAYAISQWMIADVIGVSENTVNRWLRHELTKEKKQKILDAIETCKVDQGKDGK